jgi:hypothetical protein
VPLGRVSTSLTDQHFEIPSGAPGRLERHSLRRHLIHMMYSPEKMPKQRRPIRL